MRSSSKVRASPKISSAGPRDGESSLPAETEMILLGIEWRASRMLNFEARARASSERKIDEGVDHRGHAAFERFTDCNGDAFDGGF